MDSIEQVINKEMLQIPDYDCQKCTYMQEFQEQMYFSNLPQKYIEEDNFTYEIFKCNLNIPHSNQENQIQTQPIQIENENYNDSQMKSENLDQFQNEEFQRQVKENADENRTRYEYEQAIEIEGEMGQGYQREDTNQEIQTQQSLKQNSMFLQNAQYIESQSDEQCGGQLQLLTSSISLQYNQVYLNNEEESNNYYNTQSYSLFNQQCNNEKQSSTNFYKKNYKKEEKYASQIALEQQKKELQELENKIQCFCDDYKQIYKQDFSRLNHYLKKNPEINRIVNQLRDPLVQYYKRINIKLDHPDITSIKLQKQQQPEYQIQENHCMCSVSAKFTKLSSLRNHVYIHHNQMPMWIWQVKMSKNPGAPQKNIPDQQQHINKRKNERYDKKIEKLNNQNNYLQQKSKRQINNSPK